MRTVLSCMRDVCAPTAISVDAYSARNSVASFSCLWVSWSVVCCIVLIQFFILCRLLSSGLSARCVILFGRYGLACLAAWVPVGCVPARFVLPNGRFHALKRPVRQARTGRIAVVSGAGVGVGAAFVKNNLCLVAPPGRLAHRAGRCVSVPCAHAHGLPPRAPPWAERLQNYTILAKTQNVPGVIFMSPCNGGSRRWAYIHYIYVSLAGGYSRAGFRKRGVACAVCCQWRHGRGSPDVMALPADM